MVDRIGNDFNRKENPYIKKFFSMMSGDKVKQSSETNNGFAHYLTANPVIGNLLGNNGGSSANAGSI